MFSSSIFLIFMMALVCIQCDNASPDKAENFTKVAAVGCTHEYRENFGNAIQNASCKPHYRHVALKPMPGQMFNPPLVSVPRCDGQAGEGVFCGPKPTGIRIKQVPVSVFTLGSNGLYGAQRNRCTVVEVEEHISCHLMCIEQPTDCNVTQKYNKEGCKCVCMNREKCSDFHEWDDKKCQCTCRQKNTDCTTGFTWDLHHCKCLKTKRNGVGR